jgi:hypothetical protein
MRELLELYEVYKDDEFLDRIFPICHDPDFFKKEELLNYLKYWEDKKEDYDRIYRDKGQSAGKVLDEEYIFTKKIIENFLDVTKKLTEINLSSAQELKDNNFEVFIENINKVYKETI